MPSTTHRFGEFELHPGRFELCRNGQKVRIERIPLELLILLVEKNGQLVSRQEIIERLWGKDVFLDTEHGINTAIRKVRAALQDERESPQFIQTVSGKGYRFIPAISVGIPTIAAKQVPESEPLEVVQSAKSKASTKRVFALAAVLTLTTVALLFAVRSSLFRSTDVGPIHSIAVLPLANLSGERNQDYLADGLTDEITTMVAKQTTLRVVSRTSAMQFKDAKRPLHSIARELGVDGILEGSVSRVNDRVHITVQLIYGPTDTHIWAESYDRSLGQTFDLPSEISLAIARKLNTGTSVAQNKHVSPEAHDAYLQARYFWMRFDFDRSREYYERAIQLQPDYAAAWAGLSSTFTARAATESCPVKEVAQSAEATARKALELDDNLAEAHLALAAYYFFLAWDPTRADVESRRSIQLDPDVAEQYHLHSYILFALNRPDEAIAEQKRGMDLVPYERVWGLGKAYLNARRFDDAIAELRMRSETSFTDSQVRLWLSRAYWFKHMWGDSQRELEEFLRLEHPDETASVHQAYLQGGEPGVERWLLAQAIKDAPNGYLTAHRRANQYAYLGDRENTLKYLEAGYRERDAWMIYIQNEPEFDFVHQEPRYRAVVRSLGLQLASYSPTQTPTH